MNALEQFKELVSKHDLTYSYSDDYSVYQKGDEQYKAILKLSKELPKEVVVQIWNENVDKKLLNSRSEYYWVSENVLVE